MKLADDTTVKEEARKAFSDTTSMKERIDRMERELGERTDYESDDYMRLVERFTQEHERYLLNEDCVSLRCRVSCECRREWLSY